MDQSRRVCDAVAGGQLDVAIIGGEVPEDLQASLKAVTYAEDQLVRLCCWTTDFQCQSDKRPTFRCAVSWVCGRQGHMSVLRKKCKP